MNTERSVSPNAISRILAGRGFRKAILKVGCWSAGFRAVAFGTSVRVFYTGLNSGHEHEARQEIVKIINERPGEKYWATLETMTGGIEVVMIHPYDKDDFRQKETCKAEIQEAVPLVQIREVLSLACREFIEVEEAAQAGWVVERDSGNDSLVRVSYRDHPETKYYENLTGDREGYVRQMVEWYGRLLTGAGYPVTVDFDAEDEDWNCIVGPKPQRAENEEQAKEAFDALRGAVEDAALSFMTRKGGPKSLFVYYLVPFKDKVRRLEVFWRDGMYHSASLRPYEKPKMIGTSDVHEMVNFCREELDW